MRFMGLAGAAIATILAGEMSAGAADRSEPVASDAGRMHVSLTGKVAGAETQTYLVEAQAGQVAAFAFVPTGTHACYFDVTGPDGKLVFDGTMDGHDYEGTLPQSGAYAVRIFVLGPEAQNGVVCDYTIRLDLS